MSLDSLDPLSERLSHTIKQCRHALGMSKSEMAQKIGRSVAFLECLENGEHTIDLLLLNDLALALDVSPSELIEFAENDKVLVCVDFGESDNTEHVSDSNLARARA